MRLVLLSVILETPNSGVGAIAFYTLYWNPADFQMSFLDLQGEPASYKPNTHWEAFLQQKDKPKEEGEPSYPFFFLTP